MTSTITETTLFLSRWVELSVLVKATILLALGLTAVWLARRGRASIRHLLLTATFAMLLALPLIVVTAPGMAIEVPLPRANDPGIAIRAVPTSGALLQPVDGSPVRPEPEKGGWSAPPWPTLFRSGWIAGAMLLFLPLAVALWRVRCIRRDGLPWPEMRELMQSLATECGVRRSVQVLLHEDIPAPLTCGVWRPVIVLPADARGWSEADLRRALVHELEHVRRGDWAIQLAARATCACYWFHPLVWVAWRRLRLEAERAADDAVVQSAERAEYAEQLVMLARRMSKTQTQAALGMANRSDLAIRVSALLDVNQRRGRAGLVAAASAMSVASVVVLAIAPVRAVAQSDRSSAAVAQESGSDKRGTRQHVSPLDQALYEAAENGDISGIDRLLGAGANVNCALDGDGSPLIGAAREGRPAAVRLLLDRGADPNMPVPGDGNPLIMAAREGHANIVALLLDRGASIDQLVPADENALIQASGSGHLEVVKLLVGRGADVNARVWVERTRERPSGEWRTPLSMARKGGHAAVVAFLLSAGAWE